MFPEDEALSTELELTRRFTLSERLAVEMSLRPGGMQVSWEPDIPAELSDNELAAYTSARNQMIALFLDSEISMERVK